MQASGPLLALWERRGEVRADKDFFALTPAHRPLGEGKMALMLTFAPLFLRLMGKSEFP